MMLVASFDGSDHGRLNVERPTCKTCPYFVCAACDESPTFFDPCCEENGKPVHDTTLCKRYPLIVLNVDEDGVIHGQPAVYEDDWCGEHPDFPAYIASLKRMSSGPTLKEAIVKYHGSGKGLSVRSYRALMDDGKRFLDLPLKDVDSYEVMMEVRYFGRTSQLDFDQWRETLLKSAPWEKESASASETASASGTP
jgi:hypothetical protein